MLLEVTRPTLKAGSADETDGNVAQTTVVYGVPLTGTKAPNVRGWGQLDAPTDATAVFPTDARPSSQDGSALNSADYRRAMVSYLNASGREVNTLDPAKSVTTTEYDAWTAHGSWKPWARSTAWCSRRT